MWFIATKKASPPHTYPILKVAMLMLSEWRNGNNSLYFRSKSIVLSSVQKDGARQQIFTHIQ